jgi:uncharacterized protein (TIGR00369 family)
MDAQAFLTYHNQGLGRLLGITFRSAEPQRVVAELSADESHCTRPDVVHGGAIMTLADCTSAYGAVLNLPPGCTTATIESKTNFLRKGAGRVVRAESVPIHIGRTTSVWRCSVHRGEHQIAEVTQTQMFFPDADLAWAPPSDATEARTENVSSSDGPRPGAAAIARNFSQSIVDERWKQIFDAACLVIGDKGFARATIREIAAAAGMPVRTMYQYLEKKEDLLHHIFEFLMSEIADGLRRAKQPDASPDQLLEQLIRTMLSVFDRHERSIKILFQETRSLSREARQRVYSVDARHMASIRALLESGVRQSGWHIRDAELTANFIWFLCTVWPLRHWALGKFGQEQVANELVAFVWHGLGRDVRDGVNG